MFGNTQDRIAVELILSLPLKNTVKNDKLSPFRKDRRPYMEDGVCTHKRDVTRE